MAHGVTADEQPVDPSPFLIRLESAPFETADALVRTQEREP